MTTNSIQALIFDMDGVLWRAYQPIVDLKKTFDKIQKAGLKFAFATNNSTRSISDYQTKLKSFGLMVKKDQIFTSSVATAQNVRQQIPDAHRVFVVGESGLKTSFEELGFELVEEAAEIVAVGLDLNLSYQKLAKAARMIEQGAAFFGTNPDYTFPTPEGLLPGAGSLLAFMQAATAKEPIVSGKPHPTMFKQAIEAMNSHPANTLVVGDRLETDILGGQNAGCKTALVLSGISKLEAGQSWKPKIDYIAENIEILIEMIIDD